MRSYVSHQGGIRIAGSAAKLTLDEYGALMKFFWVFLHENPPDAPADSQALHAGAKPSRVR
jgi:hypothetical protein